MHSTLFLISFLIPIIRCLSGGDVGRADDLCYLLAGSADSNVRAANEDAIAAFYLQSLREALPEDKQQSVPSEIEFKMYYKMATQGLVYRCLMFTLFLSGAGKESCRSQLGGLVRRSLAAIADHGLHAMLAVGRKSR